VILQHILLKVTSGGGGPLFRAVGHH